MDFVADALFDGRKLRMLTVVDCYTRECLAIEGGTEFEGGRRGDSAETHLRGARSASKQLRRNGSEFISKVMGNGPASAASNSTFSRPGKPTDSARAWRASTDACAMSALSLDDAQGKDRGLADLLQREPTALRARLGHTRRTRPPMRLAGRIGDPQEPGVLLLTGTETGTGSTKGKRMSSFFSVVADLEINSAPQIWTTFPRGTRCGQSNGDQDQCVTRRYRAAANSWCGAAIAPISCVAPHRRGPSLLRQRFTEFRQILAWRIYRENDNC